MVKRECQSSGSNEFWQRAEGAWSIPIMEGVNYLSGEVADKIGKGTTMVESSIIIPSEGTNSALLDHSPVLWSEKCCSLLTSFPTEDGTLLSSWNARRRRCIGTEVATFSFQAGGVPCGS